VSATNAKLTMPPGFRWVKNGIYTEGALLSDYDPRRSGTSVRRCIDERDAIEIAHAIVRPAVEAATAELRAAVEKAESDLARVTAQRDREKKRGDDLHKIVAKVAGEGHAAMRRAEKAEAERDGAREGFDALKEMYTKAVARAEIFEARIADALAEIDRICKDHYNITLGSREEAVAEALDIIRQALLSAGARGDGASVETNCSHSPRLVGEFRSGEYDEPVFWCPECGAVRRGYNSEWKIPADAARGEDEP